MLGAGSMGRGAENGDCRMKELKNEGMNGKTMRMGEGETGN